MKHLILMLSALVAVSAGHAQVAVHEKSPKTKYAFTLASPRQTAAILYDASDAAVVKRAAELFAADVEAVTGRRPQVTSATGETGPAVIVGTVGGSALIRRLAEAGKIDTAPLEGAWERYLIQTVANPLPGIRKALVIAGSDRRGAAYGLFTLSELIGVSPWYWWADVPVKKHAALHVDAPPTYSQTPSVRYRGIFLNDEDWGLTPWASQTFEPERGNIGPRTYAKVCELLLRLKANYLAPAMHPVSTSFNQIPENKLVADTFAIVMGSTHCEPLLLNTASEWDTQTMGPWNYDKNKEGINRVLTQRVRENSPYENVYTLALRGLHDGAMSTTLPMHEKVRMLQQALLDQRRILAENIDRPVETVPQAFTPYKEVLEIYSNGLELPDDITIVWPDDNYGYMKRLSGVREQRRTGRSGVYYHVSYLGVPHSYLWFSTTPPSLMYEELRKAYDTTADRLWLVNCGDLKGSEMQVSLFLDMAWDIGRFTADNVVTYPARWLAGIFGEAYYDRLEAMTREHLRLAFPRKPEYMGWGYHWNRFDHNCEQLTDTDFSFTNYDEAQRRLEAYRQLGARAEALLHEIGDEARPAFYQLVYYPLRGAELMNRMTLGGQRNRWYARQGRAATNAVRDEVQRCYDSLQVITRGYNSLLGGKWNHMMSMRQNYDGVSAYFNLPHLATHDAAGAPRLALQVAGEDVTGARAFHALPAFDNYLRRTYPVEIYNRGGGTLAWTAHASEPWVVLSKSAGKTADEERITVGIDWEKAPSGNAVPAQIVFRAGEQSEKVLVSLFNPTAPSRAELRGIYVENNGCVSIPAAGCHRVRENDRIKITVVEDLGIEGPALQLGDPTAPLQIFRSRDVPCAEYDFYAFDAGSVDVYTYVLPTFPLHADRDFRIGENTNTDTKYSVQIDDGALATPSSSHVEYSQVWFESVLRNCAVNKSTLHIDKPGRHTLRIRVGDPGIVLQKIVLDFGGMKRSYLGPQSTLIE
ncbi:glycosyl hydrolase 115 family protein [Alistipes onderdonkii]|uniref:glycosyl hydrolase 115 family protein n=1 Tax=Alistipes onderdonkii TaxID=328813 RepID=UPI001EDEA133|nr:glycosyl hydrolase 115 family protein [Alistipes onderdonkii]MCG4859734.1 glycosyl hydrolase 115 family protein [Alistipes onderdonkii]